LRVETLLGMMGLTAGERGHVPRFVISVASDLQTAFERELDAIAHDGQAFPKLEIVAHRARNSQRLTSFAVTIDRPGGVDIGLCERIAARLNGTLESFQLPYALEVESAGLDRPLLRPADYERFSGQRAKIVTTLTVNGNKTHRGTLAGIRGESVVLQTEAGELPVPFAAIRTANLEYDPRADLQRAKRERKKPHAD
jgi:ribosome maturation factor RimP